MPGEGRTLNFQLCTFHCRFPLPRRFSSRRAANSFVSPSYAIPRSGALKFQSSTPQSQALLSIPIRSPSSAKPITIIDSATYPINGGAPTFPYRESPAFLFSIPQFRLHRLALLKTYNCELTTTLSARRHFHLGNRTNLKVGHYRHLHQAAVALRFSHFLFSSFGFSRIYRL
jgi:hypothetical protein